MSRLARAVACAPILAYQRLISPALPRRCKYEPTCSRYAVQAISRYGALRGLVLASWRLLRCNPWSYGGYDPVDAQRVFAPRSAPHAGPAGGSSARPTPARRARRGAPHARRAPTPAEGS